MDNNTLIFLGTLPWVFFLFVVLFYIKNNRKKKLLKSLFLFAFIYAAIRYGIGYDYYVYKDIIEGNSDTFKLERLEVLPRYLAIFSGQIHYQLFFAVCSFITIYSVYYVSKRISTNPTISFSVYLLFPLFYVDGLGVIRNAVAYSLVFLMFYELYKGQRIKSILFWLLAIGFHYSAFVAVLIYPFYYLFNKKSFHIAIYILSLFGAALVAPLLENHLSQLFLVSKVLRNVESEITSTGGTMFYVINFIAILNLLLWRRLVSVNKDNILYLKMVNLGVCLWNLFLFVDPTTALRLSNFFLLYITLLFPSYRFVYSKVLLGRAMITFVALLFVASISLNLYAYYGKGRNMSVIPYQVFFLNPSNQLYHED